MGANVFLPIPTPDPTPRPAVDSNLKTITGATNASPIVIETSTPHGFLVGDIVAIKGVRGNTNANGTYQVKAVVDLTHFSIEFPFAVDIPGNGFYAGGGKVAKSGKRFVMQALDATPIPITSGLVDLITNPTVPNFYFAPHSLVTGDEARVKGVPENDGANGDFTVTFVDGTHFTEDGSVPTGDFDPLPNEVPVLVPNTSIDLGPFPVVLSTFPTPHGYATGSIAQAKGPDGATVVGEIVVIDAFKFSFVLVGEDIQFPDGALVLVLEAPEMDLVALVGPCGVEPGKTITLRADYSGRVVVEGSIDGQVWTPLLQFDEGAPGGVKTDDSNVRFLRVRQDNVQPLPGQLGPVVLVMFLGAEQNCECGADHGCNVYDDFRVPTGGAQALFDEELIPIFQADSATPIQVTTQIPHPYVSGDKVKLEDVLNANNNPYVAATGSFIITVLDEFNFLLNGTIGNDTGTGGNVGIVTAPYGAPLGAAAPIRLRTETQHGLSSGDRVRVQEVTPVPANPANGDFFVTVTSPDELTLDGSATAIDGRLGQLIALASAPLDVSGLKPKKTLLLGLIDGPNGGSKLGYLGQFVVEGTCDPGPTPAFLPVDKFSTGGAQERMELSFIFHRMRIAPSVNAESDVKILLAGQETCPCTPPPPSLSCCPCSLPPGQGTPDPDNFCTDFPGGVIDPFVVSAGPDPGFSLGTTGDDAVLAYDGTTTGGQLFLAAPGPSINPSQQPFCFCAVMDQDVLGIDAGGFVGLSDGDPAANPHFLIATNNPLDPTSSFPNYIVHSFNGAIDESYDTGIPIDGTPHKFVICTEAGPGQYTIAIDDGAPVPFSLLNSVPAVPLLPFIGINATSVDSEAAPFALTVDSFCASTLGGPPPGMKRADASGTPPRPSGGVAKPSASKTAGKTSAGSLKTSKTSKASGKQAGPNDGKISKIKPGARPSGRARKAQAAKHLRPVRSAPRGSVPRGSSARARRKR